MSELVKSFVFDLQRFADTTLKTVYASLTAETVPSDATVRTNGAYYWASSVELSATKNSKHSIIFGEYGTVESGTDEKGTAYTVKGATDLTLAATDAALSLTGATNLTLVSGVNSKSIYLGEDGKFDGSGTSGLKLDFGSATAANVSVKSGAVDKIYVPTVNGGTLTYTYKNNTASLASGLGISFDGSNATTLTTGGTGWVLSGKDSAITLSGSTTPTVTSAGPATKLFTASGTSSLNFAGSEFVVSNKSGKSYFAVESGTLAAATSTIANGAQFVFSTANDAILLNEAGATLATGYLASGSKVSLVPVTISADTDNVPSYLTYTGTASSPTFSISGLENNNGVTVGSQEVGFTLGSGDSDGAGLAFNAKDSLVTAITSLDKAGDMVSINAGGSTALFKNISINGSAVSLSGNGFSYNYVSSKNIVLTVDTPSLIGATGNATELTFADALENSLKVGSTSIYEAGFTSDINTDTGMPTSYFILKSGAITGVVLGEAGDSIVVDNSTAAGLGIYKSDDDSTKSPSLLFTPAITNAASSVTYAATEDSYEISGFKTSSSITDGDVTISFSTLDTTASTPQSVVFTASEANDTVYALAQVNGLVAGDSISVDGDTNGIYFGLGDATAETAVSVAGGSYTYSLDTVNGAPVLTLTNTDETVYSAGDGDSTNNQTKVVLADGSTNFAVGASADELATFDVSITSGAYFVVDNQAAAVAFNFGGADNAIGFGEAGMSSDFVLTYTNGDATATLTNAPTVNDDETGYVISMEDATTDKQSFKISGIDSVAAVEFSSGGEQFTFGENEKSGAVYFGTEAPTGVEFTDSVLLSAEAAALLGDEDAPFSINGTAATITDISNEVSLAVDGSDIVLSGLVGGETVVDGGPITKIIAPDDPDTGLTFGADSDTAKTFKVANGSGSAYFSLSGGEVTSFVFADVDDAITGNLSELKLQDGAAGKAIDAPTVYDSKDKAKTEITVTKGESYFTISDFNKGDYVTFGETKLTFETLAGDTAAVAFDSNGDLVAVTDLDDDDAVRVENAAGAVNFDLDSEDKIVNITGSSFLYTEGETPIISEVTKGATIKQVAGASLVSSATDSTAAGAFTFADGKTFTLAGGDDFNGVGFIVDESVGLSGINSISGTESVTGALEGLSFNEADSTLQLGGGSYTVFMQDEKLALDGMKSGDSLVSTGGISDFDTAEEGTFNLFGAQYTTEIDTDVTFNTNGADSLTGISNLEGTVIGSFSMADGLAVNDETVSVTNDDEVAVTAGEDGITKVAKLGVDTPTTAIEVIAGGASVFGVDGNGQLTLGDYGEFGVAGNGDVETEFNFSGDTASSITGVDSTETLSGDFSTETSVDGNMLEVTNGDETLVSLVGGTQLLGLTADANVAQAEGISSAKTVEEEFEGTITFGEQSFDVTSKDGVEFLLDGTGAVIGISGIGEGEKVVGNLNDVIINGKDPVISVVGANGEPNENLTYENGTLSGVADGDTVYLADNVTKIITAGGSVTFKAPDGDQEFYSDDDSLTFAVTSSTDGVKATAITDLDPEKFLEGAIAGLSVNNKLVDVANNTNFGVIGADEGISTIYKLTDGAVVVDAAGATLAGTDTEGTFTFGGQSFTTAGDSIVHFTLDDKNAVTAIAGLSSGAVAGNFDGITTVNDQKFEVLNDTEIAVFAGADGKLSTITNVTGGASIGEIGSVSQILTESEGVFTFTKGEQEFTTSDGAAEVIFGTEDSKVTSISYLNGAVTGSFSGITVNDAEIDIVDKDGVLKVTGDGTKLTAIEDVTADATINAAGGVSSLSVELPDQAGSVTFGDGKAFVIAGDSAVTFALDADAAATGVTGLGGVISGALSGLSSVNGQTFEVANDSDFAVVGTADASDIAKLANISAGATIGAVGSVSQVLTDTDGSFTFQNGSWSVAGDTKVTFGLENSEVTSISELDGTVSGAFEDVTVNDAAVAISGDSSIAIVAGASGITEVQELSGKATIGALDGTVKATTDSDGLFTFADGQAVSISGDSEVVFNLVDGKLQSIDELAETATLSGDLNGVSIVGASAAISVEADNNNLRYTTGTLSGVADGNTVYGAADAETVKVVTNGAYTFANGTFSIDGDQDGTADFVIAKGTNSVLAIDDVDTGATVNGPLNGLSINGGEALNVIDDDNFGAVAGDGTLAQLVNLSNGANVSAAGGASQFVTDQEGNFTILGTAMAIENDTGVTFTADESGISAIDELSGTASGDFTGGIAINGEDNVVQVAGDSTVEVTSDGDTVTRIAGVTGSDAPTVVSAGGATEVGTDAEGTFTFATSGASQAFTTEGDDEVTFNLDEDGNVTGVSDFDEDGTLSFKDVEELTVNETDLTIDSTQNVSLSIADGEINYVQGVDAAISGLENATVVATGSMTVNEVEINVEGDDNYKVIVENGEVVALAEVGNENGVAVDVAQAVSIGVDTNGDIQVGTHGYNFNDSVDGSFNLVTNGEGELASIDSFAGEIVIETPGEQNVNINGDDLAFTSTADSVTVASDGSDLTAINGLEDKDAVYGSLGGTSIAMAPEGTDASVKADGYMLNVDGTTYTLLNDANGVIVNGGRKVVDLDENASLFTDKQGTYVVNNATLEVEDTDYPIIGLDGATDAYIYDPANLIIRKGTPVTAIEDMLGLPGSYSATIGSAEDPLEKGELDSLFSASSTFDFDQPLEIFATNDTKETQYIPLAGTDFSKKVHLYDGDQTVTFNNAGGNLAIVEETNAAGDPISGVKDITLGDMGDAVIMKADAGNGTYVDVTGGTGNDSVVVQGSAPVNFDMSQGGADKILMFASANARVTLEGYNPLNNPNAGIHITERWTASLADAITNNSLSFGDGELSIGNNPSAYSKVIFAGMTGSIGGAIVNLFNYLGKKQAVGFTNSAGGVIDASSAQDPMILIGNNKGNKGNSTLIGGTGDDTAIAGGGDSIDLGLGNNEVRLQDNSNRDGADITLAHGRTTITGFNGTFNLDHGDIIHTDLSAADVSFDGTNVYIAGSGFYGVLASVKADGAISYDSADLAESADLVESADSTSQSVLATASGDYTNVLFDDDGAIAKTAIAQTNGVIDVKLDPDMRANNYIGDNSGITFYDHTGEVLVNLGTGTGSIDTEAVMYSGINKVAAGAGQTTVIGGESNETLIAGQGNDSVWGAGGKNFLLGYNDVNNDKTGRTSFFVVAEKDGAANTIRGFEFVDDDSYNLNTNKITADVLDIQVQYDRIDVENGGVSLDGDNVVLFVNNRNKNSSESVIIEGARGKDFVVSGDGIIDDVIAQVNTDSLVANKFANFFVATGKNATLTVSNDIDTANIYLGGTPLLTDFDGKAAEFYGDIHVIDATGSNAKAELGGNIYDNVIMAGSGDSTLWGGDGGNDLLVAGSGKNNFSYNYGNGNDIVSGAKDGDIVDLTNIELDELTAEITSTGVELTFTDGNTLTVNSTANVEYHVGGEVYLVNEDRDGWTKKA